MACGKDIISTINLTQLSQPLAKQDTYKMMLGELPGTVSSTTVYVDSINLRQPLTED
ncbi:hypothetical protein AVDCRST_MAG94-3627 [uncultured Leptolyngbya sp.]|uniref:Uncharacterized protein n=1 Tax=uncultured Leptolyngbya sp. TaxID=332963 RepID=A0A6J4MQY0_9CYAN|nr:hypothetical protein AVDCRST_MAG94-3627 [uncultured Leptolyngbya sp.]